MSFNDRWNAAVSGGLGAGDAWNAFRAAYPTLAEVFLGVPSGRDENGRPPCKILIFAEADKLKFMLSPLSGPLVAFGTFSDPIQGFQQLELELASGAYEWKKRRR